MLAAAAPAARAETVMSGVGYSRAGADLRQETPYEDNREWRNKLFLELKADPYEELRAVISVLAEHNTLAGTTTRLGYGLGLYEGYVRLRKGDFDFFVGKQTVDWSKADVSVIDTLNPRNLEEFAGREDEFVKIPTLMARAVYTRGDDTFEAAYVPFYVPSNFQLYGSDWAALNNNAFGAYEGDINLKLYTQQGFKPGIDDYPENNGVNGTVALRWNRMGENFDYQLSYVNGWAQLPLFEFNAEFAKYLAAQPAGARKTLQTLTPQEVLAFSPLYESRPVRQNQLGFGTSGALGESTVRGELTVIHPQELYTTDFKLTENTLAAGTAGFDRFLPGNLYVNLSYLGAYVADYPRGGLYLVKEWNHLAIGVLRGGFFDERFAPELRAIVNVLEEDYMLNPRLPVKLFDNTTVTAGAYYLQGAQKNRDTLFGQFRENSFAYLQLRQSF